MNNKLSIRTPLSLIVLVALSTACFAQQPQLKPSVERLRADVTYLASDKLEGRRTGTPGANAAADYIAKEFERLKLKPGAGKSGYLQSFPYVADLALGDGKRTFNFKKSGETTATTPVGRQTGCHSDFPPARASTQRLRIFVGYGITASELKYDDYAGSNASGRIAIIFSGNP